MGQKKEFIEPRLTKEPRISMNFDKFDNFDWIIYWVWLIFIKKTLKNVVNPYGDGETSEKVCSIIEGYPLNNILKKNFHDQLILGKDL